VVPSNYVQIVDSNDSGASDNKSAPPPPPTCPDDDPFCPYVIPQQLQQQQQQQQQQNQQQRPSSVTSTIERRESKILKLNGVVGGSQSTLNTFCSSSRKSQPTAVFNRLYSSDPNTNLLGTEMTHLTDDPDYLYNNNYAHIKHSHRHPHYHFRRQSQPEELRLMSRNSSSVKSFTSQSFNNPEYFQEMRPARSYDDSRASLLSRKLSNQIMLLNSELALLEQMRDHSQSYPKINLIEKDYLNLMETTTLQQRHATSSSTPSESSDVSEFHENKTSTLDRKSLTNLNIMNSSNNNIIPPVPPTRKHLFSETDSYSTLNDEITQLVSKHFSDSIKKLIAQRFNDVEAPYETPSYLRRRHSCGSSESFDDVIIPELFSSPSRIKWSFLMGLPDLSRSHSQIGSSDYKTDEYDDQEGEEDEEDEEEDEEDDDINSTILRPSHVCKIDQILKGHSAARHHHDRDKTVSIWQTSTRASSDDCSRAVIFHHDSGLVENCCENHFKTQQDDGKKSAEEDSTVYEFELCTKENCEYLLQSQIEVQPTIPDVNDETTLTNKNQLNNEASSTTTNGNKPSNKNINLKHNKFKMKKKAKKKSSTQLTNRNQSEDLLMWSKLNLSHIMKKESCVIDSVNLKPNSNSSSSTSLNNVASTSRKNLAKCYKKSSAKLRQQNPGSLDIATLILASSSSTQARLRSDGAIYFSNPDLSAIPADLRQNMTTRIAGQQTITTTNNNNNSCQFINNDLRNSSTTNNNNNTTSTNNSSSRHNSVNRRSLVARLNAQRRVTTTTSSSATTAANYLNVEESSINSNNIDIDSNNSDMMMQQLHLRRRLRYNQFNLHGIVRRAQRRARKYFNALRK
jgi:hypothetical protein